MFVNPVYFSLTFLKENYTNNSNETLFEVCAAKNSLRISLIEKQIELTKFYKNAQLSSYHPCIVIILY